MSKKTFTRLVAWLERSCLRTWSTPVGSGLAALVAYVILGPILDSKHLQQSSFPFDIYLAQSFLRGQLYLVSTPPYTHDLVDYGGHLYLYWPPLPAVLFMPIVALFGIGVSDVLPTVLMGCVNVALVSLLLRELGLQKVVDLSVEKRAWLTAFFALGTVHVTLAPHANVWATTQLLAFGLECGVYLVALRMRSWRGALVAGLLAGAAFLTRNPAPFGLIWAAWYLLKKDWGDRKTTTSVAAAGAAPVLAAVVLMLLYDYARFGNPIETGLAYQLTDPIFMADQTRYGAINLRYVPNNLFYFFVAFPYLAVFAKDPELTFSMGGSLFLLSPVFFFAIVGIVRSWRSHGWLLAASCVLGIVPALLNVGTGWAQFGARYTLDVTVPLLIATAIGVQRTRMSKLVFLILLSIELYLPGTLAMGGVFRPF